MRRGVMCRWIASELDVTDIEDMCAKVSRIDNLVSLCTKCHEKVHRDEINLRLIDTPPLYR
jgi:hypothetical protein